MQRYPLLKIMRDGMWGSGCAPLFPQRQQGAKRERVPASQPTPSTPSKCRSPSALPRLELPLRRINF